MDTEQMYTQLYQSETVGNTLLSHMENNSSMDFQYIKRKTITYTILLHLFCKKHEKSHSRLCSRDELQVSFPIRDLLFLFQRARVWVCTRVHVCLCMRVIYTGHKNKKKWVEASKIICNIDLPTHGLKFMSSPRQ